MKRYLMIMAVVSVGMFAIEAGSAQAKQAQGGVRPGTGTMPRGPKGNPVVNRINGADLGTSIFKVQGIKRIDPNLPTLNNPTQVFKPIGPIGHGPVFPGPIGHGPVLPPKHNCHHDWCFHGCGFGFGWMYPEMCSYSSCWGYSDCDDSACDDTDY